MNKSKEQNPREIPTKQDPYKPNPETDPNLEPDESNPLNPQDDETTS